jgi:hypothetical protein
MSEWPKEKIGKLAGTDDVHVAPFRSDGKTYGTWTWVWSVAVGGRLYVRAYRGNASIATSGFSFTGCFERP